MEVLASVALIGALAGLIVVGLRYRAERRESARVRTLFSRYLAPPIVDELLRRKDPRLYTGRSLHATILVCRIWNFAGFTEALSAQETLRYLNEFFALAGTSIQKYRGMIDKFLGDGIIGVFGVPLEDPEAEEHALRAALDIVRLVSAMDQRWRAQGRRSFQVGIGINSGEVIAGDAGFHERREFTVVGPETLLAERLQAVTIDLNACIIASATTCAPVRDRFAVVPLTGHPVPGLRRLADAFIVRGLVNDTATLVMPAAAAFKETTIEGRRSAPLVPRVSPEPPAPAPLPRFERDDPPAPMRPRRRQGEPAADAYRAPEFGIARRHEDDGDRAIFPDPPFPPGRRGQEDGGPPIGLPS